MSTYLLNAFSLNMVSGTGAMTWSQISVAEAADRLIRAPHTNAIGHQDTDLVVRNLLACNHLDTSWAVSAGSRQTVALVPGDQAIVAQYIGPRLPEGATSLPEGSRIEFFALEITG